MVRVQNFAPGDLIYKDIKATKKLMASTSARSGMVQACSPNSILDSI